MILKQLDPSPSRATGLIVNYTKDFIIIYTGSLNRGSTVVDLWNLQNYEIHIKYLSMFHTLQNSSQYTGQFPEKDSIFFHNAVSAVFL